MPKVFAARLAPDVIIWQPAKYDYTGLVNQTQGNAADPSDGFEASFLAASQALASLPGAHDRLASDILEAGKALDALGSIATDDITRDIGRAQQADATGLANITAAIGGLMYNPAASSAFPPAPAPVTLTGAGVGSTGGGSPVSIGDAAVPAIASGLGVQIAGTAVQLGWITPATYATIATVVPIVGAVIAVGLLLLHFFGGGCGSACTDAARAEQIYEAASDNLFRVAQAGMVTKAQAVYAMRNWIQAGVQHESQFKTQQAKHGAANLTKVITQEIADVNELPVIAPRPLNMAAARKLYVMSGNWYYDSLQAAAQLTDAYLENLPTGLLA